MLVENKILPKEITELFNDVIDSSYQKIKKCGLSLRASDLRPRGPGFESRLST